MQGSDREEATAGACIAQKCARRRLILAIFKILNFEKSLLSVQMNALGTYNSLSPSINTSLKMPVCVMESFWKSVTLTHCLNSSHRELLKPRTSGRAKELPACVFACAYMRVSISLDNNKGRRLKASLFTIYQINLMPSCGGAGLHGSFHWNNKTEQAPHCDQSSEESKTPKVRINDGGLV